MNDKAARLDRNKGAPQIEITVGQLNFGKFQVMVWDSTGHNPAVIGQSTNVDNIPDIFGIAPDALAAHLLIVSWEVIVASYTGGEGGLYSVTAEVQQDGVVVPNGLTEHTGKLNGPSQLVFGSTRLVTL